MSSDMFPYGSFEKTAPNPQNAKAFVEYVVGGATGRGWRHGMPRQLLDVIAIAPAHFAPTIQERLMNRLPTTVDEFMHDSSRDNPQYSLNVPDYLRPYGTEASRLLIAMTYLDRASAEPVLREFTAAIWPLIVEAKQRYGEVNARWQAAWTAAGKPTGDARYEHEELVPLMEELAKTGEASRTLTSAWTHSVAIAGEFGSPMFVDDVLGRLSHKDPRIREIGSWMTSYVLTFAAERPDAVAGLRAAAARLSASDIQSDREAGVRIEIALDPARDPVTDPELWRVKRQR